MISARRPANKMKEREREATNARASIRRVYKGAGKGKVHQSCVGEAGAFVAAATAADALGTGRLEPRGKIITRRGECKR